MTNFSASEKEFALKAVRDFEIRPDGRNFNQTRDAQITLNTFNLSNASVELKFGGNKLAVISSKASIIKGGNSFTINLTGIQRNSQELEEMASLINRLLSSKVNTDPAFLLDKGFQYGVIIDVICMSRVTLADLAVIWKGITKVVANTEVPPVVIFSNDLTGQVDFAISSTEEPRLLGIKLPELLVYGLIANEAVLEPSELEFVVADALILIGLLNGDIQFVESIGIGVNVNQIINLISSLKQ